MSAVGSRLKVGKGFLFIHFATKCYVFVFEGFRAFIEEMRNGVAVYIACANAYIVAGVTSIRFHG